MNALLAAISGNTLVYMIVILAVIAIVWVVLDWIGLPPPINKIAQIILIVVGAIVLINILLSLAGHPLF